jgi:haloalkane dehalogenase
MHFVDEGPRGAPVVLLLHGEPTWSFLYRTMIPRIAAAGLRAVAPDHVGFGRSDKLADRTEYTMARHVAWLGALLAALDLRDVTLVGQDWGGPIGLAALAAAPERFSRVVAANTILPTADPELTRGVLEWRSDALLDWIVGSQRMPRFAAGAIVAGVCRRPVAPEVVAGYDAPFPDERFAAAARHFPVLIPITPGDPGAATNRETWRVLERWERPFLTAFSDGDPATRGWETIFQRRVPGARGQPHATIANAGHFLQEDAGPELADVVIRFVAST